MTEIEAIGYTTEDAEKAEEVIRDLARKAGVAVEEAADAVYKVLRELPPIGEAEIAMIRCNPSLSWFQKWRLIRSIRKDQRRKQRGKKRKI